MKDSPDFWESVSIRCLQLWGVHSSSTDHTITWLEKVMELLTRKHRSCMRAYLGGTVDCVQLQRMVRHARGDIYNHSTSPERR